jgi:hypothetical protein
MPIFCWALPYRVEFWFIKEENIQAVESYLEKKSPVFAFSSAVAQAGECIPMGDGCFNPQTGYVSNRPSILQGIPDVPEQPFQLKTFNAIEIDLISCDPNYYFDVFCGQSVKTPDQKNARMEIWIDTSSSLRIKDYDRNENCYRRRLAESLQKECGDKVSFSAYNNLSLQETNSLSSLCTNYGENDADRLIEWVKASNAPYLLVVTDLDEYSNNTRAFLDSIGAITRGVDIKDFYARMMLERVKDLKKSCQ